MLRTCLIVAMFCTAVGVACGQEKPAVDTLQLTLSPAAEPRPALQHSLWRQPRERLPGNGATYYYRAMLLSQNGREALKKDFPAERLDQWLTMPIGELPVKEMATYLDQYQSVLEQLETAARREECKWDLRVDQLRGTAVISFLLPDFQQMRELSRIVAYKARYEIAQGKYPEAIATLRLGYQMAHDCAEPPLLINALIGIAISAQMNGVLLDLIDAKDSPNMYWALKQLPHPLIDIRPAVQFEMSLPYQLFPFLADAETSTRTPQEWQRVTQDALATLNAVSSDGRPQWQDWQARLGATAVMLKAFPVAKKQLIANGFAAEAVEKMPVAQVVAIQAARNYRYTYDEIFKWTLLPHAEGGLPLRKTLDRLKTEGYLGQPMSEVEILPIASLLIPSMDSVLISNTRADRRLAALETIEAIRLHAAARRGELPSSLEDLAIAPASQNPFTGRLFDYRRDGERAVLEERAPGVEAVRAHDRNYLIELSR